MLIGGTGRKENRFQPRADAPVDAGHLILLVEIRGVAQALHQDAGPLFPGIGGQQAAVVLRRHIGQVRHGAADHVHPLVGGEHGLFVAVDQHADIHLVKALGRPTDDIHMPQGDGVEAAGVDRNFHGVIPRFPGGGRQSA